MLVSDIASRLVQVDYKADQYHQLSCVRGCMFTLDTEPKQTSQSKSNNNQSNCTRLQSLQLLKAFRLSSQSSPCAKCQDSESELRHVQSMVLKRPELCLAAKYRLAIEHDLECASQQRQGVYMSAYLTVRGIEYCSAALLNRRLASAPETNPH